MRHLLFSQPFGTAASRPPPSESNDRLSVGLSAESSQETSLLFQKKPAWSTTGRVNFSQRNLNCVTAGDIAALSLINRIETQRQNTDVNGESNVVTRQGIKRERTNLRSARLDRIKGKGITMKAASFRSTAIWLMGLTFADCVATVRPNFCRLVLQADPSMSTEAFAVQRIRKTRHPKRESRLTGSTY